MGMLNMYVNNRIKCEWMKWREVNQAIIGWWQGWNVGKFYELVAKSTMLYGFECWPVVKKMEQKLSVYRMEMLRWMYLTYEA